MNYKILLQLEQEENISLKLDIVNLKLELQDSKIMYDIQHGKKIHYMNKCEELEKALKDLQSARVEMNQAIQALQNKYISNIKD